MVNHDATHKFIFKHPVMVRELILGFVDDDWLKTLDYSSLELVSGQFVSEELGLRLRNNDIIWRLKVDGDWVYIYLLLEFQRRVDRFMALRISAYLSLLYQDLVRQKVFAKGRRLPPVLPIVLYNGPDRWTAPLDLGELIPPLPGALQRFVPRFEYFLIDERAHGDTELASQKNLVAALFRLEHSRTPIEFAETFRLLALWLKDQPELSRYIAKWVKASLHQKQELTNLLPNEVVIELNTMQEVNVMLADNLVKILKEEKAMALKDKEKSRLEGRQEGRLEGRQEGIEEGMEKGQTLALQRLLTRRFGTLPASVIEQIAHANHEQIESWLDAVLDAPSLAAIFPRQ